MLSDLTEKRNRNAGITPNPKKWGRRERFTFLKTFVKSACYFPRLVFADYIAGIDTPHRSKSGKENENQSALAEYGVNAPGVYFECHIPQGHRKFRKGFGHSQRCSALDILHHKRCGLPTENTARNCPLAKGRTGHFMHLVAREIIVHLAVGSVPHKHAAE